jgi:pimeloyl-ACP methyl ester carboxylesterase
MSEPRRLTLDGGRTLAYDDVGDPSGHPVVSLHGTPDSRLARHPDDGLAAAAGVRLLALDRPGYGQTSPLPVDAPTDAWAPDVLALLDALDLPRVTLMAWSGGALDAVTLASAGSGVADRLGELQVVAGVAPRDAFDEPEVREVAEHRMGLFEMADTMTPADLAEMAAPLMAPFPCDRDLARAHQAEHRDRDDQSRLATVPGGPDRMVDALVEAVGPGLAGVERDVVQSTRRLADAVAAVEVPVRLWYGSEDTVTPPVFGEWYVRRLPKSVMHRVEGAGHFLTFTHWRQLLASVATA